MTDPNITRVLPRRTEPPVSTAAIRIESAITCVRDFYDALWDWMPLLGGLAAFVWLLVVTPRR